MLDSIVNTFTSSALDFGAKYFLQDEANENAANAADLAYDRSRYAYLRRYQDTVADMRAAGLNPILAASGGFSVGNAPVVNTAQTFMAQPSAPMSIASSGKEFAETERQESEVKKNEEEIKRLRPTRIVHGKKSRNHSRGSRRHARKRSY